MIGAAELSAFVQVIIVDLLLAGDNAVVIAMAAAGLPRHQRKMVILSGVALAAVLRIILAILTVQLLKIPGLILVGGILLLWVAWKLAIELRRHAPEEADVGRENGNKTMFQAIVQIIVADATMSLDNVLAVAAIAREHPVILAIGLILSVLFMGIAATFITRLLDRYRWIAWLGVWIIVWVAGTMIYDDGPTVLRSLGLLT